MRRRPRLRTVLLLVNLVLLALPLTGVWLLRLYESALIRQTESELLAQASVLAASYRVAWMASGGTLDAMQAASVPAGDPHRPWPPLSATLDLADDRILPPPLPAAATSTPPEPASAKAGEQLQPVLRESQRLTLAAIRIVDPSGIVVATTGSELNLSLGAQEEIVGALRGAAISTLRRRSERSRSYPLESLSRGSDLRVFVALPALEADRVLGAVLLSRTPRSIDQALYSKRWHLAALALVLVGGGALMAWFTALTISRPIDAVTRQARLAAAGDRNAIQPLQRRMTREVAELSASIITMAETLQARADYISGFATEVSHEFKTPLAAMRGTVELLRDHLDEMSEAERRRFLDNLSGDIERLGRLVQRLLDLARADVGRPVERERCHVDAVVETVAHRFREQGLEVEIAPPAAPLEAAVAAERLESVLANLFDNVRQHAGAAATATISWRSEDGAAVIEIADDGRGISSGNAGRIFDRFFTTAREAGGTGLGLPIARSQLAAVGGAIRLLPSRRGARFEVRLPR